MTVNARELGRRKRAGNGSEQCHVHDKTKDLVTIFAFPTLDVYDTRSYLWTRNCSGISGCSTLMSKRSTSTAPFRTNTCLST
jgi:hypothetical protein